MSTKNDPCKKNACKIQKCLQENHYQESACLDVLEQMRQCCLKFADRNSVCCSGIVLDRPYVNAKPEENTNNGKGRP